MSNKFKLILSVVFLCITIANAWAIDLKLADTNGTVIDVNSYQGTKPVLLFFWTTWCPFCVSEIKVLNRAYAQLEQQNVAVLGVNAGEPLNKVNRFLRNNPIKFVMLLDEDNVATESLGIIGVPTFILLDKKGVVRFKGNHYPRDEITAVVSE